MFLHAAATEKREYDHAICLGRQEPLAEQDLEAEPSAISLFNPELMREEITEIYHDVYQL